MEAPGDGTRERADLLKLTKPTPVIITTYLEQEIREIETRLKYSRVSPKREKELRALLKEKREHLRNANKYFL
jgi:hypothetical protein